MTELYEFIDKWDGKSIFMYVVVFIIIIWLCTRQKMGTNIIIGLLIGFFTINYLNHKSIISADTIEDIQKIKKESIKPSLNDQTNKDVIDFLFSIQDLYTYNPQQYEVMIQSINYFFELFNNVIVDNKRSYVNYGLMKQYKRDALNALMSFIYSLPEDKRIRNKINKSVSILDEILTKYLDQISYIMDNYTFKNGYSVDTKFIDYSCLAMNEYDDIFQNFSYDIY
jgi:hypothetical protein